jgi:hypothetical protein
MATDTIVVLERLRCVTLQNTERLTEPYIWPALLRIDDNTLSTPDPVSLVAPALGNARVVIKDSMHAGETADIPASVGVLRARFEDGLLTRRLILVVALLEMDETPTAAVRAGFQAFTSELRLAVTQNLLALDSAERQNDEAEKDRIIAAINKRVGDRVRAAIENGLSAWDKAKIFAGLLNLDDSIDSAFRTFRPRGPVADPGFTLARIFDGPVGDRESFVPASITLDFESRQKVRLGPIEVDLEAVSTYQIQGQLQVRPVAVDLCRAQVEAVRAAQGGVNGVEAEIRALQAELSGGGEGPSLPKAFIVSEIRRLRDEELPVAVAALEEARRALEACRTAKPPVTRGGLGGGVLEGVFVETPGGNGRGHPLESTVSAGPRTS